MRAKAKVITEITAVSLKPTTVDVSMLSSSWRACSPVSTVVLPVLTTCLATEPKALLFQTYNRATGQLTGGPLPQANAYAMIQRRAKAGGITTRVGNHTFRATGITAYLKNGGTLERAAQMGNHASTRRRSASSTSSYPAGDGRASQSLVSAAMLLALTAGAA
jgi:hypothetical protein